MKIINSELNININFRCKCLNDRFIVKKRNNYDIELLCTECERIYHFKTTVKEKK